MLGNFVSQRDSKRQEEQRDIARAEILRDAKIQYERRVEAEDRARKRKERSGEATWMNPALSKRLDKKDKASSEVRPFKVCTCPRISLFDVGVGSSCTCSFPTLKEYVHIIVVV